MIILVSILLMPSIELANFLGKKVLCQRCMVYSIYSSGLRNLDNWYSTFINTPFAVIAQNYKLHQNQYFIYFYIHFFFGERKKISLCFRVKLRVNPRIMIIHSHCIIFDVQISLNKFLPKAWRGPVKSDYIVWISWLVGSKTRND